MHVRQQIRTAAVAALTGLPTTGPNVFPGRLSPLGANPPPALFVYSLEEDAQISAAGAMPTQERPLILAIEGRVQPAGAVDPEDTLDAIAEEVESKLFAVFADTASQLRALLVSIDYAGMRMDLQPVGQDLVGSVVMRFTATYRTAEGAPTAAL